MVIEGGIVESFCYVGEREGFCDSDILFLGLGLGLGRLEAVTCKRAEEKRDFFGETRERRWRVPKRNK